MNNTLYAGLPHIQIDAGNHTGETRNVLRTYGTRHTSQGKSPGNELLWSAHTTRNLIRQIASRTKKETHDLTEVHKHRIRVRTKDPQQAPHDIAVLVPYSNRTAITEQTAKSVESSVQPISATHSSASAMGLVSLQQRPHHTITHGVQTPLGQGKEGLERARPLNRRDSGVQSWDGDVSRSLQAQVGHVRPDGIQLEIEHTHQHCNSPTVLLTLEEAVHLRHFVRLMSLQGIEVSVDLWNRIENRIVSELDLVTLSQMVDVISMREKGAAESWAQGQTTPNGWRGLDSRERPELFDRGLKPIHISQHHRGRLNRPRTTGQRQPAGVDVTSGQRTRPDVTLRPGRTQATGVLSSEVAVEHVLRVGPDTRSTDFEKREHTTNNGTVVATGLLSTTRSIRAVSEADVVEGPQTRKNGEIDRLNSESLITRGDWQGLKIGGSRLHQFRSTEQLTMTTDLTSDARAGDHGGKSDRTPGQEVLDQATITLDMKRDSQEATHTESTVLPIHESMTDGHRSTHEGGSLDEEPTRHNKTIGTIYAVVGANGTDRVTATLSTLGTTYLKQPGDDAEIREQLIRTITEHIQQARTKTQIVVDLHPRELGLIRITVRELGGNQLDIRIVTQHNATRELIDEQSDAIRLQLQKADIDVKQLTVENIRSSTEPSDTGQRQEDYFGNDSHHPQDNSNEPDERRRSWIWEWWWLQNRWRQ